MGILFLFAVAVQYNDPDPWRWAALYGSAAVACLLFLRRRRPRWLPAVIALLSLVWAGAIFFNLERVATTEMFEEFQMKSPVIEESREMFGLLIVALWMCVLTAASRPQSPQS
jgi:hypothetical protein